METQSFPATYLTACYCLDDTQRTKMEALTSRKQAAHLKIERGT